MRRYDMEKTRPYPITSIHTYIRDTNQGKSGAD